ncbi:MAG: YbdK family carboxylate-amine ligase [Gemmataceae bacterium]|nr:YbdK family carboxylate-amine ligase [Gemmataceae bacterium]
MTPSDHQQTSSPQGFEDLTFSPSPNTTLGVELELQILNPETGDLAPGAQRILDACADEKIEGVSGEFLLSMLEVKTSVCRNVTEVRDTLGPLLCRVRNIARSLGYELSVGGTHPFARPCASAVSPDSRYQRISRKQGLLAYQENIFGLHVHVGVPDADHALGLTNQLVQYLPHLLALSANSPFWEGVDTGFASARAVMFRPAAHAGVPPHFTCWDDLVRYCWAMHQAKVIASTKDLYWDIRPRPAIGTIEFRICDVPATLSTVLGLTTLVRCLVIEGLQLLQKYPHLKKGDPIAFWLAGENKWLAARYGLHASCVRWPGREPQTLGDDITALLTRLGPVAQEAGEAGFLAALQPGEFELGADRQRRIFRQTGAWQTVVEDMKCRWLAELERGSGTETSGPARFAAGVRAMETRRPKQDCADTGKGDPARHGHAGVRMFPATWPFLGNGSRQ